MTFKSVFKMVIDAAMTCAMPFLMAYMLIGAQTHEWIGTGIFLLFIIHHILNYRWITTAAKGRYTAARFVNIAVNILIFACMLGLMYSGIVLSRYVFSFLKISSGAALARKLHMLCSYWGFVLMSIHLGIHWNFVTGFAKRLFHCKKSAVRSVILRVLVMILAAYGVYAFVKRDVLSYMLLKIQFVFFDTSEPVIYFLADYAAVMILFAAVGYYGFRLLGKKSARKGASED